MIDFRWLMGAAIRQRDGERRLIEAGYRWNEVSLDVVVFAAVTTVSAIYLCVMYYAESGLKAALPFAAAAWVYAEIVWWFLCRRRIVIFHRSGSVLTPHGRPGKLGVRKLRIGHASIASIEMTRECEAMGVAIYTVEGETIIVGHKLKSADARQVAVQLTKALHELRDSIATVESTRSAFHAQRVAAQGAWANAG